MSEHLDEIGLAGHNLIKSVTKLYLLLDMIADEIDDLLLCEAANNGFFVWLSDNWEKYLGWSKEELQAKPWIEFVHPEDRQATIAKAQEMKRSEILDFVNRYQCKDGTWIKMRWKAEKFNGTAWCVARPMTNTDTRITYGFRK